MKALVVDPTRGNASMLAVPAPDGHTVSHEPLIGEKKPDEVIQVNWKTRITAFWRPSISPERSPGVSTDSPMRYVRAIWLRPDTTTSTPPAVLGLLDQRHEHCHRGAHPDPV